MLLVLTTAPNETEGRSLAGKLVEARLAACVQIMPYMSSVYFWEGEVRSESEHLLLIKTLAVKYDELEAFISENHSYEVPEIVAIESSNVSQKYRQWLESYLM